MINIDDRLLDQLDAQETYLVLQIARHMGKDDTAWPGVDRLVKLTGWTKPTVLKVRARLDEKNIVSLQHRQDETGRDKSTRYRLTTPLIGIYITSDKVKTDDEIGGKEFLPRRVNEIDPEGKGIIPEVLTNRSINNSIVGFPDDAPPSDQIPYGEILSYLNEKTGRSYRASTGKTRKHIRARWNEGFRLPDFKKAIAGKYAEWGSDPKMAQYLRPETLFGPKMEGYVEASKDDTSNVFGMNPGMTQLPAAPWSEWPKLPNWTKTRQPGVYFNLQIGEHHFTDMIKNRMVKPDMLPAGILEAQNRTAA